MASALGRPVSGTPAGAIAEAAPESAALLIPPEDIPALAAALRRLLSDPDARDRLAEAAQQAASHLPQWPDAAAAFATALVAAQA